ncbi:MAG: hypothetical protein ACHQHN_06800 [Sphingobacteriales bacterium]
MKFFRLITIVIFGALSTLLMGCPEHTCQNNSINPTFIGFSAAQIDTFIVRAYEPNDNFKHLIDTNLVINQNAIIYTTMHDTTVVCLNNSNPDHNIIAGYDWEIYIPSKKRTVTISNIMVDATQGRNGCSNPIISFVQDGQLILPHRFDTRQFYTTGYRVFITNQVITPL